MMGSQAHQVLVISLVGAIFASHVSAQIPAVCVPENEERLPSDCCPMNCGGPTRGTCAAVSEICNVGYDASTGIESEFTAYADQRFNWPSRFFQRVCKCNGNYDGFDCGECKFGYQGSDCRTAKQPTNRGAVENIVWDEYNEQLQVVKTNTSPRYKVFTGGDETLTANYKNVTLYDLIVWMHHFAARTLTGENTESQSGIHDTIYSIFYASVHMHRRHACINAVVGLCDFFWQWL